jgi:hypothetical protein
LAFKLSNNKNNIDQYFKVFGRKNNKMGEIPKEAFMHFAFLNRRYTQEGHENLDQLCDLLGMKINLNLIQPIKS